MLPKMVVFDLAGTTVHDDDSVGGCLREALAEAGLRPSVAEVNAVMGIPKPIAIRQLLASAHLDTRPERVDEIHADFVRRMIEYYRHDSAVVEVAGTSAAFAKLRHAGIHVAVDTGFSRDIVAVILKRLGWEKNGLIDSSITSDEVEQGRPEPDMILALMAKFGIATASLVAKVGDTPSDLHEGTNAGCAWVIGVTEGTHTKAQLAAHPHTHLVGTVAEVPALFGI